MAAKRHRLIAGKTYDLATGWNFNRLADREQALADLDRDDPILVLLSPVCAPNSQMRHLNKGKRDPEQVAVELREN